MRRFISIAVLVGILVGVGMVDARATELRFLTSWSSNYRGTEGMADVYKAMVEKASNGAISIIMAGPETVPPFEQLEPVQAGAFDLLFTHTAYHAGVTTANIGVDATVNDPVKRREAGVFDFVDKHYQSLGLKLLSLPASGGSHFLMRAELPASGDFSGLKIRGTPPVHPIIKALGGSPVVLPGGEIYTALERGVVDGANWPVLGAIAFKWYEVASYFVQPVLGNTTHPILMNLDRWNELSPAEQKILSEQGKQLELDVRERFDAWEAEETKAMIEKGMKKIELSPEVAKLAVSSHAAGYWAVARSRDPEVADELYAIAEKAGLLLAPQ